MEIKRVVITGLGALTPIGNNVSQYWKSLIEGVSGANLITHFDPEKFKTKFACELKGFDTLEFFSNKEARKIDACTQYALVTAMEAIKDSALSLDKIDLNRVGAIYGTGIGGVVSIMEPLYEFYQMDRTPKFSPFFITKVMPDIISGMMAIQFGFKGPNYTTSSACASSANAIADAYHLIQLGKADIIFSGGSEACIIEPVVGGFSSMHALSTKNDDFKTASRPFDLNRDGFVMGEGACTLILEELGHAIRRNAPIYAEIAGVGMTDDAYHITSPHPEGEGAMRCMKIAVEDAGLQLSDIDHINTHGTSTPPGDIAESKAIANLFGDHAPNILVNSTKSMTGHLLGAAAAAEGIAAVLAIKEGIIPPTINQFDPDPSIPALTFVRNNAIKKNIKTAISNSFGFGGHNMSLLFKAYEE